MRILKEEPSEISFNNFSDAQYDNYWKLQAEAVKGGKKISHEIGKIINVLLSEKPDELKKGIGATYKWYAKDVFSKGEGSAI